MTGTPDNLPPVLSVPEAAKFLRIGRDQCYELCRQGRIPHVKFGRSIRIPSARLLEWLTSEADRAVQERLSLLEMANRTGPPWKRLKTS